MFTAGRGKDFQVKSHLLSCQLSKYPPTINYNSYQIVETLTNPLEFINRYTLENKKIFNIRLNTSHV